MDFKKLVVDALCLAKGKLTYGELRKITGIHRGLSRVLEELDAEQRVTFQLADGQVMDDMPVILMGSSTIIRVEIIANGERSVGEISGHEVFIPFILMASRTGKNLVDALAYLACVGSNHVTNSCYAESRSNRLGV